MYENTYWGAESSNIAIDPNPRLHAYIAAARRGAKVRVLLDAFFDDQDLNSPRSNLRAVEYLTAVAQAEGLDLQAQRRNPTGLGIHNKMVLAQIGGKGWVVLVLVKGNPLADIRNAQLIEAVFLREQYYDRDDLDRLLSEVGELARPQKDSQEGKGLEN